jgi:hypothetical protein
MRLGFRRRAKPTDLDTMVHRFGQRIRSPGKPPSRKQKAQAQSGAFPAALAHSEGGTAQDVPCCTAILTGTLGSPILDTMDP